MDTLLSVLLFEFCFLFSMTPIDLLTITASELQILLNAGVVSSRDLVCMYLDQIQTHNHYLKAVLQTVPREKLLAQAECLDRERAEGVVRGPLHGIPILIKVALLKTQPVQDFTC